MQAGNESNQAEVLAQEYIEELLQRSVPATYLPLLIHVLQEPAMPLPIQVGCYTAWALQHSHGAWKNLHAPVALQVIEVSCQCLQMAQD